MNNFQFRKIVIGIFIIVLLLPLKGLVEALPSSQGDTTISPTMVSYQGNVVLGRNPYSGTGYFKFVITNYYGDESYWSNDGTSKYGGEPDNWVPLEVDSGLFNVLLGDVTVTGVTQALTADIFSNDDRWLRVWFSKDGETSLLLNPDTRIASVPYALQAQEAVNADTLDGKQGSDFQMQVDGSCDVGTIKVINPDGSVVCEVAHLTKPGFTRTTVDAEGNTGIMTSITIGEDGLPVISYRDAENSLKVVHCGDIACTSGNTVTTVDACECAVNPSITIGSDYLPVISYYDVVNADLKVAHCDDIACTQSTITTVDTTDDVGRYSQITIGVDGLPIISYDGNDDTYEYLKVVHCGDVGCTSGNILSSLVSELDVINRSSIAIGVDGLAVISYHTTNGIVDHYLYVLHCADIACTESSSIEMLTYSSNVNLAVGGHNSIAIGDDGFPVISYSRNPGLGVGHCSNVDCSDRTNTIVDETDDVGFYNSITIGADNLPVISYFDSHSKELRVAHCGNAECTSDNVITIIDDTSYWVGEFNAITIGVDGFPIISYYDDVNETLKVAHCSSVYCIPYWRRR